MSPHLKIATVTNAYRGRRTATALLCVVVGLVWFVNSLIVSADPFTIGAYDDDRSNRRFMGVTNSVISEPPYYPGFDYYETLRPMLLHPSNFGPGGVVNRQIELIGDETGESEINVASASTLAGLDLLIMSEVMPLADQGQADAEYAAIADFVLSGGCLVMLIDHPNSDWVGMANGVLWALDGGTGNAGSVGGANMYPGPPPYYGAGATEGSFVDWSSSSKVLHGPFPYLNDGTNSGDPVATDLADARLGASIHHLVHQAAWSRTIAERVSDSSGGTEPLMMEIPPEWLGPDAGAVLVSGDPVFNTYFVHETPETQSTPNFLNVNNAKVLMNFIAQQMEEEPPPIPEPGSMLLLLVGVVGLIAGSVCLRRRPE